MSWLLSISIDIRTVRTRVYVSVVMDTLRDVLNFRYGVYLTQSDTISDVHSAIRHFTNNVPDCK